MDFPDLLKNKNLRFLNLRGNSDSNVKVTAKIGRILRYYARLIAYAARTDSRVFHILWNNRFEYLDRTVLMLYYRMLGKHVVLTAHNVNAKKRDRVDSLVNRLTLRMQYRICSCIFVHTEKMKQELTDDFGVLDERIRVIPFGINNSVPITDLTAAEAKRRLGLSHDEKTILFFGRITPYKGLEYLIDAFLCLNSEQRSYRLIIAGRIDRCPEYWAARENQILGSEQGSRIIIRATFIPEDDTETYFKAADVLALPYREIYQSGVLFLAHSFGLPVLASDVGSLKDDIIEGRNGLIVKPEDAQDLARAIREYFVSDLYRNLSSRRQDIQDIAAERHSWKIVAEITKNVYSNLQAPSNQGVSSDRYRATS